MDVSDKHQTLAIELIHALRAKRSQTAVSRTLGYTYNVLYRWESGRVSISWQDFQALATACKAPLDHALRLISIGEADALTDAGSLPALRGSKTDAELTELTHLAPGTLKRWASGKYQPSLVDVLALLDHGSSVLDDFVIRLVGADATPSMSPELQIRIKTAAFETRYPYAFAVSALLEIERPPSQRSDDVIYLQSQTGMDPETIASMLADMEELGWVKREGRRYRVTPGKIFRGRGELSVYQATRGFLVEGQRRWLEALTSYPDPDHARMGYIITPITDEALAEVRDAYSRFFKDVSKILRKQRDKLAEPEHETEKSTSVKLVFFSMVGIQDVLRAMFK